MEVEEAHIETLGKLASATSDRPLVNRTDIVRFAIHPIQPEPFIDRVEGLCHLFGQRQIVGGVSLTDHFL